MKIDIVVQARTGSSRLPGKVLLPIMGRPMIRYTLESLRRCRENVVTVIPYDDFKMKAAVDDVYEGPLLNVAERFAGYLRERRPDGFVRICGDSPLIDWRVVNFCMNVFRETKADILGNLDGFPSGQHAEVVNTEFFLDNLGKASAGHVTKGLYGLGNSRVLGINPSCVAPSMAVDTQADFDRVSRGIELCDGKPWAYGFREIQGFL